MTPLPAPRTAFLLLLAAALAGIAAVPIAPAQVPEPDFALGDVDVTYASGRATQVCVTWLLVIPDDPSTVDGTRTSRDCVDKPMVNKASGGPIPIDVFAYYWVYVYTVDTGRDILGKITCVSLWFEIDFEPGLDLAEDLPFYDNCDIYDGVLGAGAAFLQASNAKQAVAASRPVTA